MKASAAQRLITANVDEMTLEQVQRHKVKLLDAWRESRAEYGMEQAVVDGYYVPIYSESVSGFVPKRLWLTHQLNFAVGVAQQREKILLAS